MLKNDVHSSGANILDAPRVGILRLVWRNGPSLSRRKKREWFNSDHYMYRDGSGWKLRWAAHLHTRRQQRLVSKGLQGFLEEVWRRGDGVEPSEKEFCGPMPYHLATAPLF
jgi:hypothetical protein